MPCRPRSITVKNKREESGIQVKLLTDRSRDSVSEVSLPVSARAPEAADGRSHIQGALGREMRCTCRRANIAGPLSDAGLGVMRLGLAAFSPVIGTTKRSLLVLMAGFSVGVHGEADFFAVGRDCVIVGTAEGKRRHVVIAGSQVDARCRPSTGIERRWLRVALARCSNDDRGSRR